MARFVSVEHGAGRYDLGDEIDAIGFLPCDGGFGAALALAGNNHNPAFAGLVLG
jgi:hypothetical protein